MNKIIETDYYIVAVCVSVGSYTLVALHVSANKLQIAKSALESYWKF